MNKLMNYKKFLTGFASVLLMSLAAGCGGGGEGRDPILGGGLAPDTTPPTVTLAVPAAGATAIATSTTVSATFSENMDGATINASSFTLAGPGTLPVTGAVSYAVDTKTASFKPTTPAVLAADTLYTATITTGAKDLSGNALASNYTWAFRTAAATGTTPDTTPPLVTLVNPADLATGRCLQTSVNAGFSEPMDAATITSAVFTLQASASPPGAPLGGTVVYDGAGRIATLTPAAPLNANTSYTATITTGAKDIAGNALASSKVWSFTTGSQACSAQPAPAVAIGSVARFGNLGGTAGTTNSGTLTVIGGDIGSTATAASAVTGFHDTAGDIYTETGSNQGAVTGKIYTCTVSTLGPTAAAVNVTSCSIAAQGVHDAQTAFDNLSPASIPGGVDPGAGQLGGLTLFPGTYKAAAGSLQITGSDLTLDAQGNANAVWVFQAASTLTVGGPAAPRNITLINGAQAKNVFWRVGTSATINAAGGGTMVGTILASSAVSFSTVGNVALVTLNGRAVALNASVTMTNTVINVPAP